MDEPQMIHQPTDLTGHSLHLWTRNTYIGTVRVLESSLTVPEKLDLQNTRATSRHLGHWNFEHTHKIENVNIHSARIGINVLFDATSPERSPIYNLGEHVWLYIQNVHEYTYRINNVLEYTYIFGLEGVGLCQDAERKTILKLTVLHLPVFPYSNYESWCSYYLSTV